jgi:acetyltransferase-like isoleucine patch superfamily enzyme
MIHQTAICESNKVGKGTRIWAFVHILPGAIIGEDCNICDFVFIDNRVVIGNRTTIKSGVQIWDGITIGSDVFIGPNVAFTNDKYPRSGNRNFVRSSTLIGNSVSIGANATILPGLQIGDGAIIGAGAVVTRSVPKGVTVVGNPARELHSQKGLVKDSADRKLEKFEGSDRKGFVPFLYYSAPISLFFIVMLFLTTWIKP